MKKATLYSLFLPTIILCLLILAMPWDSAMVYIVYTLFLGACALILSFFRQHVPPIRRGLRFLLTYSGISFVIGWLINRLAFSPTQLLMISGREGIALSIFALSMSFLLVLYRYQKEQSLSLLAIWGIPLSEQLPAPQGDSVIGSRAHHMIDQDREEILTKKKGDLRELMVQISYLAESEAEGTFLPFKNSKRIQTSEHGGYRIQIAGAFHSNYRDQGMYGLARVGPVDPQRCNELLTMYLLDFFEQNLRDKQSNLSWNSNEELLIEAY